MNRLQNISALPPRALGFGLWWMWIYLALLSPAFVQSPFSVQPVSGPMLSFFTIGSGALIYLAAIPVDRRWPGFFRSRNVSLASGALASAATALMAFSALFGGASEEAFVGGSLLAGVGVSVLYLQWGVYYAQLETKAVAPCSTLSFLLAIVGCALVLDRGILTSIVAIALPLGCFALLPRDLPAPNAGDRPVPDDSGRRPPNARSASARARLIPASVIVLILVFSFAFGLFRVLVSPDDPSGRDMGLLLLCSAGLALVMLAIIMLFSVSLGGDFIIYLALPLIAVAAFGLSVVDFGDRSLVWAFIVAAVRCADLIMWMIFANLSHGPGKSPIAVFALGKLAGQVGVLAGISVAQFLAQAFDTEQLLLPAALMFLVLATLLGSFAAIRGRVSAGSTPLPPSALSAESILEGGAAAEAPAPRNAPQVESASPLDGDEPHGGAQPSTADTDKPLRAIARDRGLSPRETEIFLLLAKGRSIPYIAEELVVANSTVTTHVRGLYRKLDIHNRQELLDFVEAWR